MMSSARRSAISVEEGEGAAEGEAEEGEVKGEDGGRARMTCSAGTAMGAGGASEGAERSSKEDEKLFGLSQPGWKREAGEREREKRHTESRPVLQQIRVHQSF